MIDPEKLRGAIRARDASPEQLAAIYDAAPADMLVACPGSGKTFTAASRFAARLADWKHHASGIALLSFTNVAVTSFQAELKDLGFLNSPTWPHFIGTIDSFLTRFVLHNFGHIAMKSADRPEMIGGDEQFLKNSLFSVWIERNGKRLAAKISDFAIDLTNDQARFVHTNERLRGHSFDRDDAIKALKELGRRSFYTHDQGRYWAYRTIRIIPRILEIIAHRFPEVIVDEAQDTSAVQQEFLERLRQAGSNVMFIGDPDQSIYEFGQARPTFLREHAAKTGAKIYPLSRNYRSNDRIISLAKKLCSNPNMEAERACISPWEGPFITTYEEHSLNDLISAFRIEIEKHSITNAAVLARSRSMVNELSGKEGKEGVGSTQFFAYAAIDRDRNGEPAKAFGHVLDGLSKLMPGDAEARIRLLRNRPRAENIRLRTIVWKFVRDPSAGLPPASLHATKEWLPLLKSRLPALLGAIRQELGIAEDIDIDHRITKRDLPDAPLSTAPQQDSTSPRLRICTVHSVKGESLDAVLFVLNDKLTDAVLRFLISPTEDDEEIRIAYVAITRPRHLLWLAIPKEKFTRHRVKFAALECAAVTEQPQSTR